MASNVTISVGPLRLHPRTAGIAYLLTASVIFSFAGVFVKGVDAGNWEVIFWRAFFGLIFLFGFFIGVGRLRKQVRMSTSGVVISLVAAASTIVFISSFQHTSIANVAVIFATTPLWAGLLGWWLTRETLSKREIAACFVALLGVWVVVDGTIDAGSWLGDSLAILMAITFALVITLFRKYPDTPTGGVNMLACAFLLPICVTFGDPFSTSLNDIFVLLVFAGMFMVAFVTLQEGAKLLSPSMSALLGILETPLAPFWGWMILSETPSLSSLFGGLIIVSSVILVSARARV